MSLFDFSDHFSYLHRRFAKNGAPRGAKSRFSEYLRIQPAFFSQVLARKYPLSLEQADRANHFFDHTAEEAKFFLLLVGRDRAATPSLKKHYDEQIGYMIQQRMQVKGRLGNKKEISDEVKGVYYSSWIYPTIHVACTIPQLRKKKDLARHFGLPDEIVSTVLEFLEKCRLLEKRDNAYWPTETWVRLDKKSPHIVKHHTNFRLRAIQNLELQNDDDLHYSGVFSLDSKTAKDIQDRCLDFLKAQVAEIQGAPEVELVVFNMDFFKVKPSVS